MKTSYWPATYCPPPAASWPPPTIYTMSTPPLTIPPTILFCICIIIVNLVVNIMYLEECWGNLFCFVVVIVIVSSFLFWIGRYLGVGFVQRVGLGLGFVCCLVSSYCLFIILFLVILLVDFVFAILILIVVLTFHIVFLFILYTFFLVFLIGLLLHIFILVIFFIIHFHLLFLCHPIESILLWVSTIFLYFKVFSGSNEVLLLSFY